MCNPFLYTILTKQLRRDFYLLISRFGLCTSKALRFRPTPIATPCTHLAYYRHYHRHRHNAKCLATIGSANSGSSSNCQSVPGFSDCINVTNTSNSYSASASQFSSSMYNNESHLIDANSKNRHQSKIQRYYYRNPYPHHHFSVSKQYKEPPFPATECCSKYKHKEHKKHVHCYHHNHHHRKHPHSAPVSQIESQSILLESNSENLENNYSDKQNKLSYLNANTYLNNALSTSILYNQNLSSCSSSNELTNGLFNNGGMTGKLVDLDYSTSITKDNNMISQKVEDKKTEFTDALKTTISTYQSTNNGLLVKKASFRTNQANSSKANSKKLTSAKLTMDNKSKRAKKEKSIKFKFKLSFNKQNKTNEIELKKMKPNSKLSNHHSLENRVAYLEIDQHDQQFSARSQLESFDDRKDEHIGALKENYSKELINQLDDPENDVRLISFCLKFLFLQLTISHFFTKKLKLIIFICQR